MSARRILWLPLAAALAAAGCGGEEDAATGSAGDATATATAAPARTPEKGAGGPRVDMRGFEFRPARVEVEAGGSVTWFDRDRSNHNVNFKDPAQRGIDNLRPGGRQSVRFTEPGTYAYVCTYHPSMDGKVVVR